MWMTKGFEAEKFEDLKAQYANYYSDGFVNQNDVGHITYEHNTGICVDLNARQIQDFINEVNDLINGRHEYERFYS